MDERHGKGGLRWFIQLLTPQAVWDALNDDLDRQEAVEYADLIKAVQQYEEDNPDEPREPLESEESVISPVAVE